MGKRLGGAAIAFDAIGRGLTGAPASVVGPSTAAVTIGVIVHVAVSMFWAVVAARLTRRWRGRSTLAALAATAAWFSTGWVVARLTGHGLATLLPLGDHIVLALVFALSLVLGMRFAFLLSARV
jgi:hypothetical protein